MFENYVLLGLILGAIAVFAWFEVTKIEPPGSNFGLELLKRRLKTQGNSFIGSQPHQGT